jgi:uncharacterized protein YdeI (YjbR/CyaY-like superfamily)
MKQEKDSLRSTRPRNRMPSDVKKALAAKGLMKAYRDRPPYQRNDYLGWICRAVRLESRQKRLGQMLQELERGGVYMKMEWKKR